MPMVWHDAVSQHSHVKFFYGFFEDFLKEFVIFVAFKYLHPSVCSIDYVVNVIADVSSFYSCHTYSISQIVQMVADPIYAKCFVLAPSYSCLATTIASTRLNCRVRNENGCDPSDKALAHKTRYLIFKFHYGAGRNSELRTG